ncbi:MAG: type VI secretion system protein TssR [Bacteroidetes bacterium]|nr:type VI secretion system protein TssR [Bacteroidota bacterium]
MMTQLPHFCQIRRKALGIFLLICLGINIPQAFPQGSIPKVKHQPSRYNKPSIHELDDYNASPNELRSTIYWVVFSDRQENKTYTKAGGDKEMATLGFLDKYLVIEESGMYIHLAQDKDWEGTDENLTKNWKDFGWIHKKYMLLWKKCLRNDNNITLKAMLINTREAMEEAFKSKTNQSTIFYSDPVKKTRNANESNLFSIFFVFKQEGDFYLVGKTDGFTDDASVKEDIYGWVYKKQVNIWNTRNAWEPNSRQDAVDERMAKNIKTSTFYTFNYALQFRETMQPDSVQWDADPFENRKGGEYRRFPILSRENGIVKLSVYGGFNPKDVILKAKSSKAINEKRKNARIFNVVFVIDGTESMKPYFSAVVRGIAESVEKLSQKNTMRFGAVVYRDFAEGPAYLAETIPMTPQYDEFNQALLKTWSDDKNKNDKDEPEAVNYGLHEALIKLDIPKEETNILILVGDAGNHDRKDASQVSDEEIINLLYEKNMNFLVYQVHHKGTPAYSKFQVEAKNIIGLAEMKRYNVIKSMEPKMGITVEKPSWKDIGNNTFKLMNSSMIGRIVYSEPGKGLTENLLQFEIAEIVEKAPLETEKWLVALSKVVDDGIGFASVSKSMPTEGKYTSDFQQTMLFILANTLQGTLTKEELEGLKDDRYEFSETGYSPERCEGLKENLYEPVVFLTFEEYYQLLSTIMTLIFDTGTTSENRKKMQDVWNQLLAGHLGEVRKGMSLEEAMRKVTGLPSRSPFIKDIHVEDIIDPNKFPDDKFNKWLDQIAKKYNKLNKYLQDENFKYKFRCNDSKFYWIEESDLP